MKKLLILGSSNGACEMVRYAKSQGYYTIVTDYLAPEQSTAKKISDEFWMINTGEIDSLEVKCREESVSAVFCGVSGFNLMATMELTKRLNLPFYTSKEVWNLTGDGDKSKFKKICRECDAPVATDYYLSDDLTDEEVSKVVFPVVVKPVDRGANVGISFCYNLADLKEAFKLVRKVSSNPGIIVERMLHGDEWFSTYALSKGKARFLSLNAMYHEPGYPSYCYSLTTTATSHIEQYLKEINPKIEEVLKAMGCKDGYAWVQVMRDNDDGKFYIIEMGYRLDADMLYYPMKYMTGYDVTKAMIDYACGIDSEKDNPLPPPQEHAYIMCGAGQRFWTKKAGIISRIEGVEKIEKIPGVLVEMRCHVGDKIDIYRYLGTIAYATENCDKLCEMIDTINKTIHVYDENGEDIIIKYTDFENLKRIYKEGLEGK